MPPSAASQGISASQERPPLCHCPVAQLLHSPSLWVGQGSACVPPSLKVPPLLLVSLGSTIQTSPPLLRGEWLLRDGSRDAWCLSLVLISCLVVVPQQSESVQAAGKLRLWVVTLRCEEVGSCSHHPPALSRSLQLMGGRGQGSGCVHRLSGWWRLDLLSRERGGIPDTSRPSAENTADSGMSAPTTVTPLTQTPASCLFFLSGQGWGGGACPSPQIWEVPAQRPCVYAPVLG